MTTYTSKPRGYNAISPYLIVENPNKAIEFYCKVFGGELFDSIALPDGTIVHGEIKIDDTVLMLGAEFPEQGFYSPTFYKGTPVTIHVYLDDVDNVVSNAIALGAKLMSPIEDKFYGDRVAAIKDPFGHMWSIAERKETVTASEVQRRANQEIRNLKNANP